MFIKRVILALTSIAVICIVFRSHSSAASAAENIGIAPAIVSKTLNPGTSISGTLNLTNFGTSGYNYTVYASPYGVQNETYQPVFKKLPGFTSINSWFSFNQTTGFLPLNQYEPINYTLTVPIGTPPGSYYGAVFAETKATPLPTGKDQIQINQRVGSLFYINVNGQAYEHGSISSWAVPFFQSSPITASLRLANSGKLYYVTNVKVNFEDIFGHTKYRYETQKIVIPKVIRNIPVSWPKPPVFGLYKVKGTATVYGTKTLSTHYVFIVSNPLRVIFIFIVLATIMYLGLQNILINIFKSKFKRPKNAKKT